jgi:hypothetical protein
MTWSTMTEFSDHRLYFDDLQMDSCGYQKPHPLMSWRNRLIWRNGRIDLLLLAILISPFKSNTRLEAENAVLRLCLAPKFSEFV